MYTGLADIVLEKYGIPEPHPAGRESLVEGDDEDRPPHVAICVGRDAELEAIAHSRAKAAFITGIGGQGKSTLAARYFADAQATPTPYKLFMWRDCKEESERFENQLASLVERLSNGRVSGADLAKQDAFSIVELAIIYLRHHPVLVVFDNVDHYVDIETKRMTRALNLFVEALLSNSIRSRAVFTCRLSVEYNHPLAFSYHLEGLTFEATRLKMRCARPIG